MELRPVQPEDLRSIIQLRHAAFLQRAPEFYSAREVENLLNDYNKAELLQMIEDQCLFLYEENGQILGTSGWKSENIRHIYVKPGLMGQGLGRKLLIHAETDYKKRTRNDHIYAGVILYAKGFYEKNGYQVVRREKAWDGSEYYFMRKDLGLD
ncbi:MAG TPA: GNAT family N-acetyltransferase [Bacillales bacterium]|nr:GNAT family N-acetyltransferase [Bacillales bacterium]